jgi:plasmid stability protein
MQTENTSTFTMSNIPDSLKAWIRERAKSNNRSMSGELLTMLEKLKRDDLGKA